MKHHHIARVLYILMVALFVTTGLSLYLYAQTIPAKADGEVLPFVPYAATIVSVTPNVLTIPGAQVGCPSYVLVTNNNISVENPYPQFGLFFVPGTEFNSYDNRTLDVPGTQHIGGYVPLPNFSCGVTPLGGPVYPVYFDVEVAGENIGSYLMDGGTLVPNVTE